MTLSLHVDLEHGYDDMTMWSVGDESVVRVTVGNYDADGYTLAMAGFVL